MKTAFTSAVSWKSQTGAGLLEDGNEESVQQYLHKICPHYELLEQLFGQRKNIVPAVVYSTTSEVDVLLGDDDMPAEYLLDEGLSAPLSEPTNVQSTTASQAIGYQQNDNEFPEPSDLQTESQTPRNIRQTRQTRQPRKREPTALESLVDIQKSKLELEVKKFEWEKERETYELEIKKQKMMQDFEIRKLELELEKEKLRLRSSQGVDE